MNKLRKAGDFRPFDFNDHYQNSELPFFSSGID